MAIYVSVTNNMSNATAGDLSRFEQDFLKQEGVINTSTHFTVTEKGSPDLSVDVSTGIAYVENDAHTEFSEGQKYWRVNMDASVNKTISSNASGSTRIDLVCVEVDDSISPGTNGELAGSITIVEGTPGSGAPTLPDDHLELAQVTVASGASSITNSEITDSRQAALIDADKLSSPAAAQTITYSGTPTIDWSQGKTAYITLGGNPTFTFTGGVSGERYLLVLKQDGTGSRTITLPASVRTGDIGTPTLTTTAGAVDYIGFVYNGIDSKYDLTGNSLGF